MAAVIEKALEQALSGRGAHVEVRHVFEGIDWKTAGALPGGAGHSLFQLLNHMVFWQDWAVKRLDGEKAPIPRHAAGSWPGGAAPGSREEWERAVRQFQSGLKGLERRVREGELTGARGGKTRLGMLRTMASHNSYHAGQVVMLRQMLGTWPPPSGGLTW